MCQRPIPNQESAAWSIPAKYVRWFTGIYLLCFFSSLAIVIGTQCKITALWTIETIVTSGIGSVIIAFTAIRMLDMTLAMHEVIKERRLKEAREAFIENMAQFILVSELSEEEIRTMLDDLLNAAKKKNDKS